MYQPAPQYPNQPSNQHGYTHQPYQQTPQHYQEPHQGHPNYNQPHPDQPANPAFNPDDNGFEDLNKGLAKNMRVPFLRKVLGILAVQFVFTALGCSLVYTNVEGVKLFFNRNEGIMAVCLVGYLICLYALGCYRSVARTVPINYILLGIFTACMTYMLAAMVVYYEPHIVFAAAVLTAGMVCALALYALTTKTDFTTCGAFLWCMFFVFAISVGMSLAFRSRAPQIAISGLGILLASLYIICDVQMIVGGKQYELSIDEYVFAAMILYIDIVRLFVYILQMLGKK